MSTIQEAPSFVQKVADFLAPREAALPYKLLTTVAKAGELALVLAGMGMLGIGVVTKINEIGMNGLKDIVMGVGIAGFNIAADYGVRATKQAKNLERDT